MIQTSRKNIRNAFAEEWQGTPEVKEMTIQKLAFSAGQYGINGGMFLDKKTGVIYKITQRNKYLFIIF